MKRVLTVGVYDYFHYGHLKLFQQAKAICPDAYLIVGVQDSAFITKPRENQLYSTEVRQELVSALRCVDEVVTHTRVAETVQRVEFDVFAVGEDQNHAGFQEAIAWCEAHGKKVVRLHRTPNISSTSIKGNLKKA